MADKDDKHSIEKVTVEFEASKMSLDDLLKTDLNHLIKSRLMASIVRRQLEVKSVAADDNGPSHAKVTHWRTLGGSGHNRSL
jgi:hypothetical protein